MKGVLGYARVSATKQKKELERQQEQMITFAHQQGWQLKKVFTDIVSGMNEQRKGLHQLLNEVATTHLFAVLCTYEDRLARFGTKVIETSVKRLKHKSSLSINKNTCLKKTNS